MHDSQTRAAGPTSVAATVSTPQLAPLRDGDLTAYWKLIAGTGPAGVVPIIAGHRVTLGFWRGGAGGSVSCNDYGGGGGASGRHFRLEQIAETAMDCGAGTQAIDDTYFKALDRVRRIGRAGDLLVLAGPSSDLRFARLPTVPIDDLVNIRWTLEDVVENGVAAPAAGVQTFRLGAGRSFVWSSLCGTRKGTYRVFGDEIELTRYSVDDHAECPAPNGRQDRILFTVLHGFAAERHGDRLTLTSDQYGLVYRAS